MNEPHSTTPGAGPAERRPKKIEVRAPKPNDLPALLTLAQRMHAEGAYSFLPFDPRKVALLFVTCGATKGHFAAVAERDGVIVGFLGGKLAPYPFCDELLATDLGFYVAPEHRASTAAVRLLRTFRAWARDQGAREVSLAISSGVDIERIGALYQRMGFRAAGGIYRERIA
jgi:GNAT superfamily N-acetyltransferase